VWKLQTPRLGGPRLAKILRTAEVFENCEISAVSGTTQVASDWSLKSIVSAGRDESSVAEPFVGRGVGRRKFLRSVAGSSVEQGIGEAGLVADVIDAGRFSLEWARSAAWAPCTNKRRDPL
jgi:hypothetical protein